MRKISRMALFVVLILAAGCREFPNPFEGDRIIARAGKQTLRLMDLKKVLPAGIAGEDSVRWVESFADRWVRDNLKLQEAQKLFGENAVDEELVQNYRNSLALRRLEQYYIGKAMGDSLYTERELRDYYNQYRNEFILDRAIVRGRVIALPSDFRQKARVRDFFRNYTDENRTDLKAIAGKNGFILREIDEWMEYPQFLTLLPTRRNESYDQLLSKEGVQEMTDGGVTYFFVITESCTPGMTTPYEMVSSMVRWVVSARRKAEIVRGYEDSIYNAAIAGNRASVNLLDS